jgi:hypothetical protein
VKGLFDIVPSGMGKTARFRDVFLAAYAAACLVILAGCVTVTQRQGVARTFKFPFLHDYSVENRVEFDWSDDWLALDSDVYHQRLAGPLSALAASVYGYRLRMDVETLRDMGFNETLMLRRYGAALDYGNPIWGRDQTGFTFAVKKVVVEGVLRDVVFVVVRGTFGRTEWLSNMNACNTWAKSEAKDRTDVPILHEGFSRAAECLMSALAAYVVSNSVDLSTAKFVVTGHSRGGAVANIVGAELDKPAVGSPFSAVDRRNVFVYAFAPPNVTLRAHGALRARVYDNIFNIVNPEDMVPRVPIALWHAGRHGHDLMLRSFDLLPFTGSWTDPAYVTMKDEFKSITGYEYWHTPLGTNSTVLLPAVLGAVAPSAADLYFLTPEQIADGNSTSVHSILEMLLYRCMDDARSREDAISLGGDVEKLSQTYSTVSSGESNPVFYSPDGRDFSRQPGMFNLPWRLSCMHATQTYIAWMKSAERHGPAAVYANWKEGGE